MTKKYNKTKKHYVKKHKKTHMKHSVKTVNIGYPLTANDIRLRGNFPLPDTFTTTFEMETMSYLSIGACAAGSEGKYSYQINCMDRPLTPYTNIGGTPSSGFADWMPSSSGFTNTNGIYPRGYSRLLNNTLYSSYKVYGVKYEILCEPASPLDNMSVILWVNNPGSLPYEISGGLPLVTTQAYDVIMTSGFAQQKFCSQAQNASNMITGYVDIPSLIGVTKQQYLAENANYSLNPGVSAIASQFAYNEYPTNQSAICLNTVFATTSGSSLVAGVAIKTRTKFYVQLQNLQIDNITF